MPPIPSAAASIATGLLAGVVTAGVLKTLLASGLATRVLDRPNARSMHVTPTPRIGGIGVLAGLVVAIAATAGALPGAIWVALAIIAVVSAIDDVRGLHPALRLALHAAAASLVAASTLSALGPLAVVSGTVAAAWSINLYNFMDGSDGLAGSMGVAGFGTLAAVAAAGGDAPLALSAAAIAGACAGFLVFNLPPARLFMGDAGSTSLGLLAAALGALGVQRGLWDPLLPATVFMPFAFDATATLLDRLRRGCRVWEAHREHAYQKLNMSGLGHRRTALVYATLMLAAAACAVAGNAFDRQAEAFGVAFGIHAAFWLAVRRAWFRRTPRTG